MSEIASTRLEVGVEFNVPSVADTDKNDLDRLGRLDPDDDWYTLRWDLSHSFYIEPVFFRSRWEDTGPGGMATLAHEVALSCRGQHAFDHRLIPNYEQVVGGMYTVRGYDESVVAGDTVIVASAEYRFHLPQALGIDPNPGEFWGKPFRRAAAALRTCGLGPVSRGSSTSAAPSTLTARVSRVTRPSSAGVGVEFLFRRNLTLRLTGALCSTRSRTRPTRAITVCTLSARFCFEPGPRSTRNPQAPALA